jgi:hypothetical protein
VIDVTGCRMDGEERGGWGPIGEVTGGFICREQTIFRHGSESAV